MKKRISINLAISESFEAFLKAEGIPVDVVSGGNAEVEVLQCDSRPESSLTAIYSGGWITCETARALAKKLEITIVQTGKMLNFLNVKIRRCPLGCFR